MKWFILATVLAAFAVVFLLGERKSSDSNDQAHSADDGHNHGEMADHAHPAPDVASDAIAEGMDFSDIEAAPSGVRIGDLYNDKKDLTGKEVIVRGKVVKFTANIMDANWIHLRDGSGSEGSNDLTVTTAATVSVGDVVTAKGVLTADRDFGLGYQYEILLEDAVVTVE